MNESEAHARMSAAWQADQDDQPDEALAQLRAIWDAPSPGYAGQALRRGMCLSLWAQLAPRYAPAAQALENALTAAWSRYRQDRRDQAAVADVCDLAAATGRADDMTALMHDLIANEPDLAVQFGRRAWSTIADAGDMQLARRLAGDLVDCAANLVDVVRRGSQPDQHQPCRQHMMHRHTLLNFVADGLLRIGRVSLATRGSEERDALFSQSLQAIDPALARHLRRRLDTPGARFSAWGRSPEQRRRHATAG